MKIDKYTLRRIGMKVIPIIIILGIFYLMASCANSMTNALNASVERKIRLEGCVTIVKEGHLAGIKVSKEIERECRELVKKHYTDIAQKKVDKFLATMGEKSNDYIYRN